MNFQTNVIAILLTVFCLIHPARGPQQQQSSEEARDSLCQRVPCRPPTTVRLKLNAKEYSEMWPYPVAQAVISTVRYAAQDTPTKRDELSDADKTEIIESVLELELKAQSSVSDFANIRTLSTDNIEFVEPSRLSRFGFVLVTPSEIRNLKQDNVVEYLVFKRIYSKGGSVTVVLSRMVEGRPCFGAPFSREQSSTYSYRKDFWGWTGRELLKRPPLPFSFVRNKHRAG